MSGIVLVYFAIKPLGGFGKYIIVIRKIMSIIMLFFSSLIRISVYKIKGIASI